LRSTQERPNDIKECQAKQNAQQNRRLLRNDVRISPNRRNRREQWHSQDEDLSNPEKAPVDLPIPVRHITLQLVSIFLGKRADKVVEE
jgi:hypothetical protein